MAYYKDSDPTAALEGIGRVEQQMGAVRLSPYDNAVKV
jgi:hypothetical protein